MAFSNPVSRRAVLVAALCLGGALPACSKPLPEPQIASSSASPGYAERFPGELNAVQRRFGAEEEVARSLSQKFASYPGEYDGEAPKQASQVARFADQEGRSAEYVERLERSEAVARFFEEEKQPIHNRVAGAVQAAAKKKNCAGAELGGSAVYALDRAVKELREERVHAASDAHALIDRNEKALGKKNVETLKRQADEISQASYVVHVGMVRTKLRLRAMMEELEDVKKTLDRTNEDLKALHADGSLDAEQRADLEEEQKAVAEARRRIDAEIAGANALSERIEDRIKATQAAYDAALKKLLERLGEKS